MVFNQDLNTLVPASKIRRYLESPQKGLMDAQGSEEIDFENVTNKVTLLSMALTDITQQIEREIPAGASDLNAVSVQLGNLHARIGEDPLYSPAAWDLHADFYHVLRISFQLTRVQHTSTVLGQKPRCRLSCSAFVTKSPLLKIQVSTVASCKLTGRLPTHNRFLFFSLSLLILVHSYVP